MFNAIRNWFNKPRITLVQRWNVATLLSLLEELPAENYVHGGFGFSGTDSGCALGLAMSKRDKFYRAARSEYDGKNWVEFAETAFGQGAYTTVFSSYRKAYNGMPTKKEVIDRLKAFAYDGYRYTTVDTSARV